MWTQGAVNLTLNVAKWVSYKHRVNKVKKRTSTYTILSVYLNRGKYERNPNICTIP